MPYSESATIHKKLLNAEHILLVPHQNPDGDTLSSVCAFMQYLRTFGRPHTAFCSTRVSDAYNFLPHVEYVTTDPSIFERYRFDIVCTFDAGDLNYAGVDKFIDKLAYKPEVFNFDHHISNKRFGHNNIVDVDASSTTMVLFNYFNANKINIDKYIATCLLTGLMTDTETFMNGATKSTTLDIGSELVRLGGNINLIKQNILKDKTFSGLKFWGIILERLYHNPKHDIAVTYSRMSDHDAYPITDDDCDGVSNFLKMTNGATMVLFLKEIPGGKVKGSMRTTQDNIDVAKIAVSLGGGGHKKAAGFTVEGKITERPEFGDIIIEPASPATQILNNLIAKSL